MTQSKTTRTAIFIKHFCKWGRILLVDRTSLQQNLGFKPVEKQRSKIDELINGTQRWIYVDLDDTEHESTSATALTTLHQDAISREDIDPTM